VIVHRLGEDDYLLVINAGTREKDFAWVRDNTRQFDCRTTDLSDDYTQLAIQGPKAHLLLARLTDANLATVKNYWFTHGTVCGFADVLIGRTGYTGEDGFEIYVPSDEDTGAMVWNAVLEAGKEWGVIPCGLGARNTLRLEARMPLYGHEISETINVWEAGLDRYCRLEKPEFVGREALLEARAAGPDKVLAGLEMTGRGIARDGYRVLDMQDSAIGYATSGSPAPFLKKNIALAFVPPAFAVVGTGVRVEVRGQGVDAQVVATPFYRRPKV
jgi:aminomethyltransferase